MTPKKPDPPKRPIGPDELQTYISKDDTSSMESLVTTSAGGLKRKASTVKKTLLGGV